jgi:flagellin FlaB
VKKKMEKKYMERLIGKYCKIVTKEPGEDRASVVTGILEDVDYKDGFILVDSQQGLGCLRINTIVAIKPGRKREVDSDKKNIKDNDKGAVGIGTLVIFISMVLVAAVAASVIMQTAENLQQRAYAVGQDTIRDVSSGVHIIGVSGYTDAAKSKIEYLAISIKPRAGSYDLDLNKTLIHLTYDNYSILSLNENEKASSVSGDGIFHTLNLTNLTATNFGAIAIQDSDDSIMNMNGLGGEDHVMLVLNLSAIISITGGLPDGETLEGKVVPEVGAASVFVARAPNAFTYRVIDLQ